MMSMTSLEGDICDYKIGNHYHCRPEQWFPNGGRWEFQASLRGFHKGPQQNGSYFNFIVISLDTREHNRGDVLE